MRRHVSLSREADTYMLTVRRASALGLVVGAALGCAVQIAGYDQVSSGRALYAAASATVASAVALIAFRN